MLGAAGSLTFLGSPSHTLDVLCTVQVAEFVLMCCHMPLPAAHYAALERQFSRPYGAPHRLDGEPLATAASGSALEAPAGAAPAASKPAEGAVGAGAAPAPAAPPLPDEWVYKDPQGVVQGPFPKQDIVEW